MAMLANLTITTAQTAQVTPVLQMMADAPQSMAVQANFTYGSAGTTVSAWVQTSFDGGATWVDACNFSFTTASAKQAFNLISGTAIGTPLPLTDGTLAANVAFGTLLGTQWRVKFTTTGTYVATTLRIDAVPNRGRLTS